MQEATRQLVIADKKIAERDAEIAELKSAVENAKPAAPNQSTNSLPPRKPHPLVQKFFDFGKKNELWMEQRLNETTEEHQRIKIRDAKWQWITDFDNLEPDTAAMVKLDITRRLAATRSDF